MDVTQVTSFPPFPGCFRDASITPTDRINPYGSVNVGQKALVSGFRVID
jgi:hypothetical protein